MVFFLLAYCFTLHSLQFDIQHIHLKTTKLLTLLSPETKNQLYQNVVMLHIRSRIKSPLTPREGDLDKNLDKSMFRKLLSLIALNLHICAIIL